MSRETVSDKTTTIHGHGVRFVDMDGPPEGACVAKFGGRARGVVLEVTVRQDGAAYNVNAACPRCGGWVIADGLAVAPPWPIVLHGVPCDGCDATYTVEIDRPAQGDDGKW